MLQHWLLREPSLSCGVPVYVCAAILFPLHLGWTGSSVLSFTGYLVIAAFIFSLADAAFQPALYQRWASLIPQSFLSLLALGLPATLAFGVGSLAGPVDEAFDEDACAIQGVAEIDSAQAEADDTFDVTPDCASAPAPKG